jgi:cytochrome c peroxidase
LIEKGLIRIGLPLPQAPNLRFEVTSVDDPYNCTTNPATGLTNKTTGIVSVYRRPLPSTNLGFLTAIMSDGREPNLASQSIDATLIHAQASAAPTGDQQGQIVAFESGVATAQIFDNKARDLDADGASGGPVALSLQIAKFFVGVNDPVIPRACPSTPISSTSIHRRCGQASNPMTKMKTKCTPSAWRIIGGRSRAGSGCSTPHRSTLRGVAGLNDALNLPSIAGFCGTCHDTPDVGNHSVKAPLNIGIANAGANKPPALDISGLPIFTLKCTKSARRTNFCGDRPGPRVDFRQLCGHR